MRAASIFPIFSMAAAIRSKAATPNAESRCFLSCGSDSSLQDDRRDRRRAAPAPGWERERSRLPPRRSTRRSTPLSDPRSNPSPPQVLPSGSTRGPLSIRHAWRTGLGSSPRAASYWWQHRVIPLQPIVLHAPSTTPHTQFRRIFLRYADLIDIDSADARWRAHVRTRESGVRPERGDVVTHQRMGR